MKKIAITILCILVMGGIGFGGYKLGEKKGREEIPNEIIVINSPRVEDEIVEEETKVERVVNEDLLASENTLKSKNNEYKMWIQMPNTNINYPVMQGPDNDIYLSTDFNGDYYYPGSIFIDYRNDIENDENIWIYGHHMKDESMFHDLVNLKDETYFNENPYITILKNGISYQYEIFSIFVVKDDAANIVFDFENEDDMNKYMEEIKGNSIFYRDVKAEDIVDEDGISSLITLVTCSFEYDGARTVVTARLLEATN